MSKFIKNFENALKAIRNDSFKWLRNQQHQEENKELASINSALRINFYFPIVITNAPMYILNKNCTLDCIEKADSISDIARSINYVQYIAAVPGELSSYITQQKTYTDDDLKNLSDQDRQFFEATTIQFSSIPRRFYYVNVKSFNRLLNNLERSIEKAVQLHI